MYLTGVLWYLRRLAIFLERLGAIRNLYQRQICVDSSSV